MATMTVIERAEGTTRFQDVEMGKGYGWCLESIVVRCGCRERLSLTVSINLQKRITY